MEDGWVVIFVRDLDCQRRCGGVHGVCGLDAKRVAVQRLTIETRGQRDVAAESVNGKHSVRVARGREAVLDVRFCVGILGCHRGNQCSDCMTCINAWKYTQVCYNLLYIGIFRR